ncbi:MAG TPA: hypothetical protein VM491_16635 [Burkholderiaceae bacterium]|nr:hypothetical protein [Burkholderiaceae bacterium]
MLIVSAVPWIASCAGAARAVDAADRGSAEFAVRVPYGGVNLTREQAAEALDRQARARCGTGYSRVREVSSPRITISGTPNGDADLIWWVRCT